MHVDDSSFWDILSRFQDICITQIGVITIISTSIMCQLDPDSPTHRSSNSWENMDTHFAYTRPWIKKLLYQNYTFNRKFREQNGRIMFTSFLWILTVLSDKSLKLTTYFMHTLSLMQRFSYYCIINILHLWNIAFN